MVVDDTKRKLQVFHHRDTESAEFYIVIAPQAPITINIFSLCVSVVNKLVALFLNTRFWLEADSYFLR